MSLASLEFDRVLELVASFARSERGVAKLRATATTFNRSGEDRAYRLARDVEALLATQGSLGFAGLDGAELLAGDANAPDALSLLRLIGLVRRIVEVRAVLASVEVGPELGALREALPPLEGLLSYCELRIGPTGEVLDSASPRLAHARASRERHRQAIVAGLDQVRREHTRLAAPYTVRRDRYCLPVPVGERAGVPGIVLDVSATAATVFVEPFAVVELNNALAEAIAGAREEEERILAELATTFGRQRDLLLVAADTVAELDAFQARVLFGRGAGGVLVEPGRGASLTIGALRHPLLEPSLATLRGRVLGKRGNEARVVPLTLHTPEGTRLIMLSGPNAGGKTVALKTVGLAFLMAWNAIPLLAEGECRLPDVREVWCHIGDEQSLLADLSTFTGAMQATAALLDHADDRTLVLYDEMGSGTDPEEGAALAAALLEELSRRRCWTVATAHLVTVAAHLEGLPNAVNAAMGFDESTGRPTFVMHVGAPGRSRGLEIAASCRLPAQVLARAGELLSRSYLAIDAYLARLEAARDSLGLEREALLAQEIELAVASRRAVEEVDRLRAARERLAHQLDEERSRLRQRAETKLKEALAELEAARQRGEMPGKRRLATVRREALHLDDEEALAPAQPLEPFAPGATVRLRDLRRVGTVNRVTGDRIEVLLDGKRLWVEQADCEPMEPVVPRPAVTTISTDPSGLGSELKLLGLTQEEAREQIERFLDQAAVAGTGRIRVVHGHGSGVLRRLVQEMLKAHPAVAAFRHPPQARGGTGVTEAELDA